MKNPMPLVSVALMLLLAIGVSSSQAMPPHPDLMKRIETGAVAAPYYMQHEAELRAQGVEAPNRIPYLHNFAQRHNLDDNFNALIILLDFSDHTSRTAASSFDSLMFGPQTGSLANFISQVTYGNLTLVTVNMPGSVGWVRLPQTYSYYVNGQNGTGAYPHNSEKMVEDAVALVNGTVDFSRYDNDGDGYVDALFVVHSGPGAEFTGNVNDIWSHAWVTRTPISVDGVSVYHYSTEPEYWLTPGDMTCGVYAHEMGHAAFGLPDLYDTGYDSQGIGRWSLMAAGSWNGNLGNSPAHPDAWCKIQMGVVTPISISSAQLGASIPAVESSPTVFRLGDPGREYLLVENRQLSGYDAGLPGGGLVIYHIDESVATNNNQWYPGYTANGHYKVAVEQADGLWGMEHNSNRGDAGDPYPGSANNRTFSDTSTPNSKNYASAVTSVAVRNISASCATMTADLYSADPRVLHLTAPNGSEMWYMREADTIRWISQNVSGNIKIEVNYAYPSSAWNTITSNAANTGSHRWVVTPGISTAARIRISSVSYPSAADTSDANLSFDSRTIWIYSPGTAVTWLAGDVDTIKWTSQNLPPSDNVKIEINRSYPGTSWSTLAAAIPNSGAYAWTVNGSATSAVRLRITGVQHPSAADTSDAFSVALRTIVVTSPNTALTWVLGDTVGIRWTTTNMPSENVRIELKRIYPTGAWEQLAASAPNNGSFNLVATGPLTSTARVRVMGTIHTAIGDTSNVNFTISMRSAHLTFGNTATTCLIGGVDTIRWTSTCMSSEIVAIQIDRDYPSGNWQTLASCGGSSGFYPWMVSGPASTNARFRLVGTLHTAVGDTCDATVTVAVPQLDLTSPISSAVWYVGDADTIRWSSQNLSENVKLEINRAYPTGSWTAIASSVPNTGSYRWMVTTGNSTTARIRISAVTHSFVKDTSSTLVIDNRSLTLVSPNTAVTWLTGDSMLIQWTTRNLPDSTVKIEINRTYSTGVWSVIAANIANSGRFLWGVSGSTSTDARIRISGTQHISTSGISAANFTIGTRRVTVTAPNTAVTLTTGSTFSTTWTSSYMTTDSVKIELNRAFPFGSWETIAASLRNTGAYSWTVGGVATTTARVRVSGVTRTNVSDTSNVNFTIRVAGAPQLSAESDGSLPTEFHLAQNCPNPFNPTTEIRYDLPQSAHVELKVFDMNGREVVTLTDAVQPAGTFRVMWNGLNKEGRPVGSGSYFYQINAGQFSGTKEMILLK